MTSYPDLLLKLMRRPGIRRAIAYHGLKLMGVEFPGEVTFGRALDLAHGAVGLVVHEKTIIGDRVKLFQGVTLGRADQYKQHDQSIVRKDGIVIEDDAIIGAGAAVLFKTGQVLTIGRSSVIGANSVVLSSVPAGEIWAGVPARKVGDVPGITP